MITIHDLERESKDMPKWRQNRIFLLVGGAIIVAAGFVVVALMLYNISGTAQLDLSRTAFQSIQNEAPQTSASAQETYPSTGDLTTPAFDQFKTMYDSHVNNVKALDAFDPNAMTNQALGLPNAGGQ